MEHSKFGFLSFVTAASAFALSVIAIIVCINVSGRTRTEYEDLMKAVGMKEAEGSAGKIEIPDSAVPAEAEVSPKYTAVAEGDAIVFKNDKNETVKVINDVGIILTKSDKELCSKGVDIYSDEELLMICEELAN